MKMRVGNNQKGKAEDRSEDRQIRRAPKEVLGQQKKIIFSEWKDLLKHKARPGQCKSAWTKEK